jgi:hypothetical protein
VTTPSVRTITVICATLLTGPTSHDLSVQRVQFQFRDRRHHLTDCILRVSVLCFVNLYAAKKVVQKTRQFNATIRVIQRKLLFLVINLRRLILSACIILQSTTYHFVFLLLKYSIPSCVAIVPNKNSAEDKIPLLAERAHKFVREANDGRSHQKHPDKIHRP